MPRKKLIYTSEFPYHIVARSNNRENFYLPTSEVWKFACEQLKHISTEFHFKVYAFVLMDNHYHLLGQTHPNFPLGFVMQHFQKSLSVKINNQASRINHVFGGPYKASLVINANYYAYLYKYIFRNPVKAGLCNSVKGYPYSSISTGFPLKCIVPEAGLDGLVDYSADLIWLDTPEAKELDEQIDNGLKKSVFKLGGGRRY